MKKLVKPGFTLAEVLIALALLGVVAAFAIPKVLQSVQNERRDTVLRETIATLSEMTYRAYLSREVLTMRDFNTYLGNNINTLKACRLNYISEGCYPILPNMDPGGGYILPTGAAIIDVDTSASLTSDTMLIDYNGLDEPNEDGEDRLYVDINLGPSIADGIKPGQLNATPTLNAAHPSTLLFRHLTSQ